MREWLLHWAARLLGVPIKIGEVWRGARWKDVGEAQEG